MTTTTDLTQITPRRLPAQLDREERRRLERRAKLLAWAGNGWHLVEFAVALGAGIAAGRLGWSASGSTA